MVGNNVNRAEVEICSRVKDEKLPAWSFEAVINEASKPNGYRITGITRQKLQQTFFFFFFCHSVAKKNSHFNEFGCVSVFNVYTPLCVWCCHIYVPQPACPPNEPYAAALIAHLTTRYSLFPKEVVILSGNQSRWDESPADNGPRLLLVVRVSHGCRLRCEWIFYLCLSCFNSPGGFTSRANLSFLQLFASTLLHWIWVKLLVCTSWLHWWHSGWMKHTIRPLYHRTLCIELNRIFFWEDENKENWKTEFNFLQ